MLPQPNPPAEPKRPLQERQIHWRTLAAPVLILLLALTLRVAWPGWVDFKLDEGTLAQKALDIARGREFPLDGVWSSRGVPTPPNMAYLLAVPFLVSDSPIVETAYVGLLSVAALGIFYWLAWRYFGSFAASLAMLFYAVSPWAVYFARRAMPFSLLPPFVALTMFSGALGFVERRPRWQGLHLIFLALTIETHLSALPLVLVTGYLLVVQRKTLAWRALFVGALVAALTTLPMWIVVARERAVIAEDLAVSAERTSETLLSPQALEHALSNTIGSRLFVLADPNAPPGESPRADGVTPLLWAQGLWLAASLAGLLVFAWRKRASQAGQVAGMFAVWSLAPVAMFTAQWTAVYHHYFVPLLPAPYLVIGCATALGAGWLAQWRPRWPGLSLGLAAALGILIAGGQLFAYARVMRYFATHFTPGDLGTPLVMKAQAAGFARQMAEENGASEVIVAGEGDRTWGHETAAVFDVLLDRVPHRFLTASQAAVFPAGRAVILLVPGEWEAAGWYQGEARAEETLPTREGEQPYRLYFTNGVTELPEGFESPSPPLDYENGVRLLGHRWITPVTSGSEGELVAAWRIGPSPDTSTDYHFVLYLQDADGRVLAHNDGPSFPSDQWREGDVVFNWLTLPPPLTGTAGTVNLRLAMYAYPSIERTPVVGPDGSPLSDAVQLAAISFPR